MTQRTLYLLLALVVVSSIALADLQGNQLQGVFKTTGNTSGKTVSTTATVSTASLHISSKGSGSSSISWDDTTETPLGTWRIKADKALDLYSLSFYIGPVTGLEVSTDNHISHFFKDCSLAMQKTAGGTINTLTSTDCKTFEGPITLAAQTYTFTLSGVSKSGASSEFITNGYIGNKVAMVLEGLEMDGTTVSYTDSKLAALVDNEETGSIKKLATLTGETIPVEYTYGGISLENTLWENNDTSKDYIVPTTTGQDLDTGSSYDTNPAPAITVSLPSLSVINETVTINIQPKGEVTISSGTNSNLCVKVSNGNYSCTIPSKTVTNTKKTITLTIAHPDSIANIITIYIATGGDQLTIGSNSKSELCTSTSSGTYSCDIP